MDNNRSIPAVSTLQEPNGRCTKLPLEPWAVFIFFRRPRGQVPREQENTRTRHHRAPGTWPCIVDRYAVKNQRESTSRPNVKVQREHPE